MDLLHNFVQFCFFHVFSRNGNLKSLDADFTIQLLLDMTILIVTQCEAEQTKCGATISVFMTFLYF